MPSLKYALFFFLFTFFLIPPSVSMASVQWGIYTNQDSDPLTIVSDLEKSLGRKFDNQLYYTALKDEFELTIANKVREQGKHLQIVLEVWDPAQGEIQPEYRLETITNGSHDSDIFRWANSLKNFGDVIYLTPMSEMNGNWMPWCGTANGNIPTDFVPAWRHIHDIFTVVGASNVRWVWSPNIESVPNIPTNEVGVYYPGNDYIDYIGMNGYNFGPPENPWMSFYDTFMPLYQRVAQITPNIKPMIIGEMASSEIGGNKAEWINEMFQDLPIHFPRIEQVYWFNVDKERDWRINSSQASLSAFRLNFNSGYLYSAQSTVPTTTAKNKRELKTATTKNTVPVSTNDTKVLGDTTSDSKAIKPIQNQILPLWTIIATLFLGVGILFLYYIGNKYQK